MTKEKINKSNEFYKLLSIVLAILIVVLFIVLIAVSLGKGSGVEDKDIGDVQISEENKVSENSIVVFETSMGNFEVELFLEESPITAGNFKKLVESNFYDGIRFHRVIKNFMIQSGDPLSKNVSLKNGWGTGGPGYAIQDEFIEGLFNVRGTLAMANSGPNSGGSQFFINVVDNVYLDWDKQPAESKHPVFGKIVEGMDVVDSIANVKTDSRYNRPVEDVIINRVYLK